MATGTTVAELLVELDVDADVTSIDEFNKKIKDSGEQGSKASKGLKIGGAAIAAIAVAAVGAGVALFNMTKEVAGNADEIAKSAKQYGVNAQQLQRMRGALELSGGSAKSLNKAILTLGSGLALAITDETGPAFDGLEKLGLATADLEDDLVRGDLEKVLGTVADAYGKMGEGIERTTALEDLFGKKAGKELGVLLASGTASIQEMGDAIERTGSVMSDLELEEFEAMEDSLNLVDKAITGVKQKVAGALAPAIGDMADKFQGWIVENEQLLQQDIPELIELLVDIASELIPMIVEVAVETKNLWNEFDNAEESGGLLGDALDVLKIGFDVLLAPIRAVKFLVEAVASRILTLAENIEGFKAATDKIKTGLFGTESTGTRGLGGNKQVQVVKGSELKNTEFSGKQLKNLGRVEGGGAGATANANDSRFIKSSTSSKALLKMAENQNVSAANRGVALAKGIVAAGNEAAATAQVGSMVAQMDKIAADARKAGRKKTRKKRKKGKGGKGKGAAGKKEPTLEELIAGATGDSVGKDLPDVASRAPTVVVQITRNEVTLTVAPHFPNMSDPDQAARATVDLIQKELVGQNVRTGQGIAPIRVR